MKYFMNTRIHCAWLLGVTAVMLSISCSKKSGDIPPKVTVSTVATGFVSPNGITADRNGNIWVADQGTGNNDGKVWMVKTTGEKKEAIVHMESILTGTDLDGPTHLLFSEGILYILGAKGKLYKADSAAFTTGAPAIEASALGVENIGAFVLSYPFTKNTHMTHPYGITKGPEGAFYIADAAANAVLRRSKTGVFSVVAEVPGVPNPLPIGPPVVESVPTGAIVQDGHILVSTLLGFPFPAGKAVIYQISFTGQTSVYQTGFTTLVDIIPGGSKGQLVVEHGGFGTMGFTKNTGRLVWANGNLAEPFVETLNLPVGVAQSGDHTWYVTSLGDKSLLKIVYE